MDGKLPEEFAPTGPKLSKFPIRPAPPIRPHLFADEARFALRLSLLAGAAEFLAWWWLTAGIPGPAILAIAALRCLKPLWARIGTRVPRPVVALSLLLGNVVGVCAGLFAMRFQHGDLIVRWVEITEAIALASFGLPALADVCATCVGDSVTVERRPAAYAWLDMAQALGAVSGLAINSLFWMGKSGVAVALSGVAWALALAVACVGVPALRDRGTPRSAWPASAYLSVLRTPLLRTLLPLAFVGAALAMKSLHMTPLPVWDGLPLVSASQLRSIPVWLQAASPLAGMALAARFERISANAIVLPQAALALAILGWSLAIWPIAMLGLGVLFAAIPAAVARGAGEMERPIASSLAWSALIAGAAVGAVL